MLISFSILQNHWLFSLNLYVWFSVIDINLLGSVTNSFYLVPMCNPNKSFRTKAIRNLFTKMLFKKTFSINWAFGLG